MPHSPAEQLASTLVDFIEAGATVPDDFVLTLIDWARRHSAIDLLMVVAASKLSPRADALIQAIPDAKVVVAWLTAPHRSPEEVSDVIRRETRKTILAAAVSSGALSDAQTAEVITRGGQLSVRTVLARDYKTSDAPEGVSRGPLTGAALCRYIGEHMMRGSVIDSSPNIPVIDGRAAGILVSEFPSQAAAVHSLEWTAWLAGIGSELDPDVALTAWRKILNLLLAYAISEPNNTRDFYSRARRFEVGCIRLSTLAQWCAPLLTTDDLKDLENLLTATAAYTDQRVVGHVQEAIARIEEMLNASDVDSSELWDVLHIETSYSQTPAQAVLRSRWMALSKAEIAAFAEEQMADQAWFDRYMGASFALRPIGRFRVVSEVASRVLARKFASGDHLGAAVCMQPQFLSSVAHMSLVQDQFVAQGCDWPSALDTMLFACLTAEPVFTAWPADSILGLLGLGASPNLVIQLVGSDAGLGRRLHYRPESSLKDGVAAAGTVLFAQMHDMLDSPSDLDAISQMADGPRTLTSSMNALAAISKKSPRVDSQATLAPETVADPTDEDTIGIPVEGVVDEDSLSDLVAESVQMLLL